MKASSSIAAEPTTAPTIDPLERPHASAKKFDRNVYSAELKNQAIAAVRDGAQVRDLARQLGVQPVQILSWIGAAMIEEWNKRT